MTTINRLVNIYHWISQPGYSAFHVLVYAIRQFGKKRGTEAAASTAFFTIFSIFPLLLLVLVLGSLILESEEVQDQILNFFQLTFPVSPNLITSNIQEVLELRNQVTIISIVSLAWSASNVFTLLSRHINIAFPTATPRGFLKGRLVGLTMLVILVGLLGISALLLTSLHLFFEYGFHILENTFIADIPLLTILTYVVPFLVSFLIFTAIYRFIPTVQVSWRAALLAAIFTAIAWEATTLGFTWYLRSGLASYRLVYGSLGAVVALMFWIYLNMIIIIFGAHLCASFEHHKRSDADDKP